MRKAQIAGQIFIYIIAIVVVGLIIVYGYSAIKGFRERGEAVEYITLKTNIENSVKSIASDYGSIKRPDFTVPAKYEAVCFVNKDLDSNSIGGMPLCTGADPAYHEPIVCAGWKTGRNNVFLVPDGSEAFDVGDIKIVTEDGVTELSYLCVPVVNNRLYVQLKGLGDRVQVCQYEPGT